MHYLEFGSVREVSHAIVLLEWVTAGAKRASLNLREKRFQVTAASTAQTAGIIHDGLHIVQNGQLTVILYFFHPTSSVLSDTTFFKS